MILRTIFKLAIAGSVASTLAAPLAAQDPQRLEQVVQEEVNSGEFMGAVLVAKDGVILLNDAWGSANLEWQIDNTELTKFRIGSVTKQFTAVGMLLLQEEGKLSLDDKVSDFFPNPPKSWKNITLRHLVRHTSGLPNVTSLEEFKTQKFLPTSQDDLINMFADLPLEFEPGSDWNYSNSGYILLSRVIEIVSDQSYADFVRTRIFDPLGMKETAIDVSATIVPKRASGYSPSDKGTINAEYVYMGIPTGAGALYSTTGDLLRWQRALFGGKVLSEASLAEYLSAAPHKAFGGREYAHGVMIDKGDEGTFYSHGGGIEGFNSWLGYDPDKKLTVVVLANLNGGAAGKLGNDLMKLGQGGAVTLTSERVSTEIAVDELAQYEGSYAISPDFKIRIFVLDGKLMTQATGQGAFPVFYESKDRFFLKVVDAQLRFERGDDGVITGLTLFQNGNEVPAAKE